MTLGARAKAECGYALLEGTVDAALAAESIIIPPDGSAVDASAVAILGKALKAGKRLRGAA